MVRIHPGPALHRRAPRAGSRAGRSIADRRTTLRMRGAEAPILSVRGTLIACRQEPQRRRGSRSTLSPCSGPEPVEGNRSGAPFQQRSRSSMYRARRFERGGCRRNWRSGACAVSAPHLQEGAVAPRIPVASTNHFPGVAQCRGNELRPRPVRVQVLPPGPLLLP